MDEEQIARMAFASPDRVRDVINKFNGRRGSNRVQYPIEVWSQVAIFGVHQATVSAGTSGSPPHAQPRGKAPSSERVAACRPYRLSPRPPATSRTLVAAGSQPTAN